MRLPLNIRSRAVHKEYDTRSHIRPSSCKEGKLQVTLPTGTQVNIDDVVDCCYEGITSGCEPCQNGQNFNAIVGSTFPQCGENNKNNCYYHPSCPSVI
jgi:hypothetical protein